MGTVPPLHFTVRRLHPKREAVFPNIRAEGYEVTSDEDDDYNCIAHAADKKNARWWPATHVDGVYWPKDAPLEETVEAFLKAYQTEGYTPCDDGTPEPGHEKVAIYTDQDGIPTHAARLLSSGEWTSKLGGWEDISHPTLRALEGAVPAYGTPTAYLKRTLKPSPPPASTQPG